MLLELFTGNEVIRFEDEELALKRNDLDLVHLWKLSALCGEDLITKDMRLLK